MEDGVKNSYDPVDNTKAYG